MLAPSGGDLILYQAYEYFEKRPSEVSINSTVQTTLNNQDTPPSSSSIIVEDNEAPLLVFSSNEQISPILNDEADELIQEEDSADLRRNKHVVFFHIIPYCLKEWSIFKPRRSVKFTNLEVCVYALTVSTIEPKNIKEAMLDHSWIESMQDKLHQFQRLDVWELEEGIDFEESFALVAHLEAVRMFKHEMDECDSMSTPMATARLDANLQGTPTDQTKYRSMIGGHMYLIASRPDTAFATFVLLRIIHS
ncbi:hypothetical protein Tco_0216312 [Tanacetum coccineum]